MYNGDSSASPLIGKYCGDLLPPNFISSTNRAFIYFHTDVSDTATGFELEYRAISGKLVQLLTGLYLFSKIRMYQTILFTKIVSRGVSNFGSAFKNINIQHAKRKSESISMHQIKKGSPQDFIN